MRIVFTYIIILLQTNNVLAQKNLDSLKSIWPNDKLQDTTRLKALKELISYTENDSALVLGKEMIDLAKKSKNIEYEVEALTLIGDIYFEEEDNEKGSKKLTN